MSLRDIRLAERERDRDARQLQQQARAPPIPTLPLTLRPAPDPDSSQSIAQSHGFAPHCRPARLRADSSSLHVVCQPVSLL